jgi:hypothetical protein
LALFLFFVIAERLSVLMAKLVSIGYFAGFLVLDSQAMVSHLQNVDDILFIGEKILRNHILDDL